MDRLPAFSPPLRLATAGLLLVSFGLAACGGDTVTEKLTEKALEASTGGDVDIDLDSDGGGIKIETEDGSYTADDDGNVTIESEDGTFSANTSDELPDGFPDLPLPDGFEVLSVTELTEDSGTAFQVLGTATGAGSTLLGDFIDAMEGDGYAATNKTESTTNGAFYGTASFLAVDGFDVHFTVTGEDGDEHSVSFLVYPTTD